MVLVFLALVAIVVAVVVAIVRTTGPGTPSSGSAPRQDDDALRALDARFARGEIDEQDYLRRRSLLAR